MTHKPLAIVIPAYKQTFLRATLQSIAAQTCHDFTLYIGDDYSPHQLKAVVDEFADDIDIVYHRFEQNLGGHDLVAQWERCIAMTDDEPYIWLFSDDDMMEPRCVEHYLALTPEQRDNYLVHFDLAVIDEFNHATVTQQQPYPDIMDAKDFLEEKLKINGKRGLESFIVEFVFSRTVYEQNGHFENYDLAWGSDFITWLKFASAGRGILTVKQEDSKVMWRKSSENITPDESHPILIRKLRSLTHNAAYIQRWLPAYGYAPSFRYTKFVWGNIKGNTQTLSFSEILSLAKLYTSEVGHRFLASLALVAVLVKKILKLT